MSIAKAYSLYKFILLIINIFTLNGTGSLSESFKYLVIFFEPFVAHLTYKIFISWLSIKSKTVKKSKPEGIYSFIL